MALSKPARWSLAVFLLLGCSSSGSSGGCSGTSATQRCDINTTATICGDRITLECFDDATPEAASQCEVAIEQDTEAVYCCTSAVEADHADDTGGAGGG